MKTLLLHIGYHRTGTTFLQLMLNANRPYLASLGCLYPVSCLAGDSHSPLALCLPSRRDELIHQLQSSQVRSGESTAEASLASTEIYSLLAKEMARSTLPRAIVSSECFLEYLDVNALREQLEVHSIQPEFIVFLRRQDRWIESVFSQVVNDPSMLYGGSFKTLPQLSMLDFAGEIRRWRECFFDSQMHIRLYEEEPARQDLVSELLRIIGPAETTLPIPAGQTDPRNVNASLDESCVLLLHQLNAWGLTSASVHALVRAKSHEFKQDNTFANWRLAPVLANDVVRQHDVGNQWIFNEFDLDPSPSWGDIPPAAYSTDECKSHKYQSLLNSLEDLLPSLTIKRLREGMPTW